MNRRGELYWSMLDPIWDAVSIYDGPEPFLEQFARLSALQRTLFAAHWCQSEVRNGGFHQLFSNPTGVLAPEAAEAFVAIGLPKCAELTHKAMQFFGTPYPRHQNDRVAALEALDGSDREEWDPFYALDDLFYAAIADEGFERAADEFVANSPAA